MPQRRTLFTNGDFYHVFNRTIDRKTPFLDARFCNFFLEAINFYRATDFHVSFSHWKRLEKYRKNVIKQQLGDPANFRVDIISYCLMPNHFHFILKQNSAEGVQNFISGLLNSFTHSYNGINKRKGALFEDRFHVVPITSKEQLLVTSRYVHLNPIASNVVGLINELRRYPWSSYKKYLDISNEAIDITQTSLILSYFNNDSELYKQFVEGELDRLETLSYVNKIFTSSGGL